MTVVIIDLFFFILLIKSLQLIMELLLQLNAPINIFSRKLIDISRKFYYLHVFICLCIDAGILYRCACAIML